MRSLVRGLVAAACAGALLSGTTGAAAASTGSVDSSHAVSRSAAADSNSPKRYENFYFLLSNCHNAGELGKSGVSAGGSGRGEDAELVALRIGEARPRNVALAEVDVRGAESPQPNRLRL